MNKNELKKQLIVNKTMAHLSHYCAGNLYYRLNTDDGSYQFPISTVEDRGPMYHMKLSPDLGTTPFNASERASMLWRWIDKAIDSGEFVEMAIPPPPEPPPDRIMKEGAEPRPPREF